MNYGVHIIDYLKKQKKTDLVHTINYFHELCAIYDYPISSTIIKEKKDDLIDYLVDLNNKYLEFVVESLDIEDFQELKQILKNGSTLGIKSIFLKYLNEYGILFENAIPIETFQILKDIVKRKNINHIIKTNDKYYKLCNGIIIAYGVIDINTFKNILNSDKYYKLICINYKKEYTFDSNKVVSNKLSNKKKINKYLKDKNIKDFKRKDFINLGYNKYHHSIKSYKKLIKTLKRNYIFKNYDIMFLDSKIIIPYLYSSINEEEKAEKDLNDAICKYFEFNSDKLKKMIIKKITEIRKSFPLWQYRGKMKLEVKDE